MTGYKILRYVIQGLVLFFVLKVFWDNIQDLSTYDISINYSSLLISSVFFAIGVVLTHFTWPLIIRLYQPIPQCKQALFEDRVKAEVGKYVPGKILGYLYLKKKIDLSSVDFWKSVLLEGSLSLVSALILCSLLWSFQSLKLSMVFLIVFVFPPILFVIVTNPNIKGFLANIFLRFKLNNIEVYLVAIEKKQLIILLSIFTLSWLFFGLGFSILVTSLDFVSNASLTIVDYVFANTLSSFIGLLVFFIPLGIGVKEGALTILFGNLLSIEEILLIAIIWRLIALCVDCILYISRGRVATTIYSIKTLK